MTNVAQADRRQNRDWPFTEQEMHRMMATVNGGYPPAGRAGKVRVR